MYYRGIVLRNLCSPDLRKGGGTVDALSENYQVNMGGPQSLPTLFSSPAYWSVFLKWKGSLRTEDDRASRCTWSPLTDPAGLTGSWQMPGTICLHLPSKPNRLPHPGCYTHAGQPTSGPQAGVASVLTTGSSPMPGFAFWWLNLY